MSVQQFVDLLRKLDPETTHEDIRDILWLAPRIGPVTPRPSRAHGQDNESRSPPADGRAQAQEAVHGRSSDIPLQLREPDHTVHLAGPMVQAGRHAAAVRVPSAPALHDRLRLGRALRPLKLSVPSRHLFQLDEQATAEKIADSGVWIPVLRAAPERWLELAVVVDGYESMSIWRQLMTEFREVLEELGVFRDVRFWVLDRVGQDSSRPGVRRWRTGAPPRSAGELTDPAGRRVIVVISDCVGPLWRTGAAQQLLAEWGMHQPVAIIQPLPQRMWTYTHARPVPVTLRATRPGDPNARLTVCDTPGYAHLSAGTVPVPVLELDAAWLASWSRLVGLSAPAGVSALAVLCQPGPNSIAGLGLPRAVQSLRRPADARQILQRFRASASPEAYQLAVFLAAAAPISLPIIQIIQKEMVAVPRQSQLAEVFLGGLLRRADPDTGVDPNAVQYEFVTDEVRGHLLKQLRRSDAMSVLLTVSNYLDVHFGQARDFRALLAGQDITGDHMVGQDSPGFARIAERVLRLMGGQYIVPADRLAKATQLSPTSGPERIAGTTGRTRSRAYPLVCPYCYHAFAEREIVFRCSGRVGLDGAACRPRQDMVLEQEMGQSGTLLPPVFAPRKGTDQAVCPSCHQPTRDQLCPRCHSRLPATFRSVEGRLIAFAGPTLAGKTAFMTVLVHELRHKAGERLNASAIAADEHTHDRYVRDYESPLYRDARLFLKTATTNHIRPLVFRFVLGQRARLRRPKEMLLSFADGAGEDLVSPDKVELMTRYLSAADGVVIMIDPLQLPSIRSAVGNAINLPPLHSLDQITAFDRITKLLRKGSGGSLIVKPVAIVLTKLDALWDVLPQDSLLHPAVPSVPYEVVPYFYETQANALQEEVIKILVRWDAGQLVDMARQNYAHPRFFSVSALGAPPTQHNQVSPNGIQPYRIVDPFLWLLRQFSFIGSRQD